MVTLQVSFEELLDAIDKLPETQKQIIRGRLKLSSAKSAPIPEKRTAGLGEGTIWISDDFDDPLPDEFWLGEDA